MRKAVNRKKTSKKDEDKTTDARVINVASMEKALEIKVAKKEAAEEELAKKKRLKALQKEWTIH